MVFELKLIVVKLVPEESLGDLLRSYHWFMCVYCHFQQYFSDIVQWRSVLLWRKPEHIKTFRKSRTNIITQGCIEYTSPW